MKLSSETDIARSTIYRYLDQNQYTTPDFELLCVIALYLGLSGSEWNELLHAAYPWLHVMEESLEHKRDLEDTNECLDDLGLPLIFDPERTGRKKKKE